jgi:hypothetical protein
MMSTARSHDDEIACMLARLLWRVLPPPSMAAVVTKSGEPALIRFRGVSVPQLLWLLCVTSFRIRVGRASPDPDVGPVYLFVTAPSVTLSLSLFHSLVACLSANPVAAPAKAVHSKLSIK